MYYHRRILQKDTNYSRSKFLIAPKHVAKSTDESDANTEAEQKTEINATYNEKMLVFTATKADNENSPADKQDDRREQSDGSESPHTPNKPVPTLHPEGKPTTRRALFTIGASGRKQIATTPEAIIDLNDSDEAHTISVKRKGKTPKTI